ncbi:MAG: FG-GAP-like repeat-containing protein [Thermoanaerobaculia bacterium]
MSKKNFWPSALWAGCAVLAIGAVARHQHARRIDWTDVKSGRATFVAPRSAAPAAVSPAPSVASKETSSKKAWTRVAHRAASKARAASKGKVERETEQETLAHESLRAKFRNEMSSATRGGSENESNPDAFDRWFYSQRAYPAGTIPSGARYNALQSAIAQNGGLRGAPGDPTPPGVLPANPTWVSIGPARLPNGQTDTSAGATLSPVSGRVSSIAVHPTNANIVYAAGAQGGLWKSTNALSATPNWTPMTDHQPSLAVGDIAIDPVNPNIVYVGTGENNATACDNYYGRGILRSLDGGVSWNVLGAQPGGPFDGQGVTKVLIDPATAGSASTTTVWASTTLGLTDSGTSACQLSTGPWNGALWRSTDSGQNWTLQNVPTGAALPNARIHDVAIDPTDSNILYVGVRSVPTAANGGVWKSVNAKAATPTFTKLIGGYPDAATANPGYRRITLATGAGAVHDTLFSAMENSAGSQLWGLYKSTDAGATWSHVDNGVNGVASITTGSRVVTRVSGTAFSSAMLGHRIIINNQFSRTVASVTDANTLTVRSSEAAFNVTNAAVSFSVSAYPNFCDGQCFYDMTVSVDPTDATAATVYVGGNPNGFNQDLSPCPFGAGNCAHTLWRSDNGGSTWRSISQGDGVSGGLHPDDHDIYLDASTTPARVYDGNDGGIWRSENKGASWTPMNTNIAITQFQGVATHPTNPNIVMGGTQDNGTNIVNPAFTPPPAWFHTDFGDGGLASIDQLTPSRMFHTYFNARFSFMGPAKSTTGGNNGPFGWDFVGAYYGAGGAYNNGMDPTDPVDFYAPLALHSAIAPKNPVYFGSNKLYRAADPQLPCCNTVSTIGCGFPGPIVCTNPPSWTLVSPVLTKGGNAFLSAIGVLPNLVAGKEVVYTGASDGRLESSANIDGSGVATWNVLDSAASPLPNRFVTWIEVSPGDPTGNTALVGYSGFNVNTPTKPGHIFRTVNGLGGAATWTDLSSDLPDVPVNAIAVDPTKTPNIIYVGTDIGVFQTLDDGAHWAYLSEGHPVVAVFGLSRNRRTGQIVSATHGRGMFQLSSDGLADTTLPVCSGSSSGNNTFNGSALDAGANDTGIASITLQSGSSNLVIRNVVYSGAGSATYTVSTINHCLGGSGNVVVRDFAGNTCITAVSLPGDVCADFAGADAKPDLVWRRDSGENTVWVMAGTTPLSAVALPTVADPDWQIGAVADYTLDGKVDLLWRNGATGQNEVWAMNGLSVTSQVPLPTVADLNWKIRASGDFNADGKPDILWRNSATGENLIWLMNGTNVVSTLAVSPIFDLNWQIAGTGDFDNDGKPDILWRNGATGENVIWIMNGAAISSQVALPSIFDLNWKIGAVSDYSGDGQPDIVWRNASTGANTIWVMNGTAIGSQVPLPPVTDLLWKIAGPR